MWVIKSIAAVKHGIVTLLAAVAMYILVFHVWYPGVFSQILPGTKLFMLVLMVEVVLGPCMSLIIFNPAKTKRKLIWDYSLIGFIQLSALVYGMLSVAGSRPVYVVFVKDRFDVVSAIEINETDLEEASSNQYSRIPWWGPEFICVRNVKDIAEKQRLLFEEIPLGKDVQHLPRFYRACNPGEVVNAGFDMDTLNAIVDSKSDISQGKLKQLDGDNVWLPIVGKMGVWVAILNRSSNKPVAYINVDPF